ncbi:MAG: hypothetical protein ACRDHZ_01295, partial [Ktedonobacteraceae bacterium]
SESSIDTIFDAIRRSLREGGARTISFEYDEHGHACQIDFCLPIGAETATFRLPARMQGVEPPLMKSYQAAHRTCPQGNALTDQVERVAWANLRDWVAAQIALIRSSMVVAHEVFLPYMLLEANGLTCFEMFERRRALPSPTNEQRGYVRVLEE